MWNNEAVEIAKKNESVGSFYFHHIAVVSYIVWWSNFGLLNTGQQAPALTELLFPKHLFWMTLYRLWSLSFHCMDLETIRSMNSLNPLFPAWKIPTLSSCTKRFFLFGRCVSFDHGGEWMSFSRCVLASSYSLFIHPSVYPFVRYCFFHSPRWSKVKHVTRGLNWRDKEWWGVGDASNV